MIHTNPINQQHINKQNMRNIQQQNYSSDTFNPHESPGRRPRMTGNFNPAENIFNSQNQNMNNSNNMPDKSFISAIVRDKDASQFYINNTNISI